MLFVQALTLIALGFAILLTRRNGHVKAMRLLCGVAAIYAVVLLLLRLADTLR